MGSNKCESIFQKVTGLLALVADNATVSHSVFDLAEKSIMIYNVGYTEIGA